MTKVWFITGCSRGLGLAIATCALDSGVKLVAGARKPEHLKSLVDKYGTERLLPVALDVSSNDSIIRAVEAARETFGHLDVVVNNAGYANIASIEEVAVDDFRSQVETNFFGVVHVTKAVLPLLRKQRSGHIFQISSLGGRVGSPGLAAYQSAKWAIGGFSTVLAQEIAPFGIQVTVLEPGAMKTDWAGSSMKIPHISEPYQPTVGSFAKMIKSGSGSEVSLPSKVASIILKLSETDNAPLRLLIGPDAVEYAAQAARALAYSDEKWRDLSISCT